MNKTEFKPKSFWQRPEGITGLLFLGALVAGGGYLLSTVNWGLIFANTLYLAGTLAVLGLVVYMVLDPKMRTLVSFVRARGGARLAPRYDSDSLGER